MKKFAVVELKYERGKFLVVLVKWIMNFKGKFTKTEDFICFWSSNFDDTPENQMCGYSQTFSGEPSLFKIFILKLADSLEEALQCIQTEGRVKMVPKRFRQPGDTDAEIKKLEAKKKRSTKKELKTHQAKAHAMNIEYLLKDIELKPPSTSALNKTKAEHTVTSAHENSFLEDEETAAISTVSEPHGIANHSIELIESAACDEMLKTLLDSEYEFDFIPMIDEVMKETEATMLCTSSTSADISQSFITNNTNEIEPAVLPISSESVVKVSQPIDSCTSLTGDINMLKLTRDSKKTTDAVVAVGSEPLNNSATNDEDTAVEPISIISENLTQNNASDIESNIIVLNFDELKKQIYDLSVELDASKGEINNFKIENESLKTESNKMKADLENANKRNLMLQNYLLEANERVPETLFMEKDGGRLYRGGVFISKENCDLLDKCTTDRDFLNNLSLIVFGPDTLKTHTITGLPSNKTKGEAKSKLDAEKLKLIYDITDSRSLVKKTQKLSTTEKNGIVGKKIANLCGYANKKNQQNNSA